MMDAVAAVRYVKSEVLSEELHSRFYREETYRVAFTLQVASLRGISLKVSVLK
ncbi:hypothetical protein OB52_004539 [Salmonella enterica subsp. enterica]|nr:hypothetical protein [Salmonella enterica subsp. enterica]